MPDLNDPGLVVLGGFKTFFSNFRKVTPPKTIISGSLQPRPSMFSRRMASPSEARGGILMEGREACGNFTVLKQ